MTKLVEALSKKTIKGIMENPKMELNLISNINLALEHLTNDGFFFDILFIIKIPKFKTGVKGLSVSPQRKNFFFLQN